MGLPSFREDYVNIARLCCSGFCIRFTVKTCANRHVFPFASHGKTCNSRKQGHNCMTDTIRNDEGGLRVYLRLLGYVRPYWHVFALSILGYVMFAASQPMFPKLVDYFIRALDANDHSPVILPLPGDFDKAALIWLVPVGVLVIGIFRGIGSFLGNYFLARVSLGVVNDLRIALFNRLVLLPNTYFDNNNSGHLISRITYNVSMVTGAATDAIKVVFREGMTVIALLGFLFWTDWHLALVFVVITPVIAIIVSLAGKRFRKLSRQLQTSMGDVTHIASETISGYRVMRGFGGETYEQQRFRNASCRNTRQGLKLVKVSAIHTPTLQLLILSALSMLMYIILYLKDSGAIMTSFSELIAFITAAGLLPKPIRQLSEVNANIQKGIAAAQNIFEQIDEPAEPDTGTFATSRIEGRIEYRHLGFTYPSADCPALVDVNITVEPGQTVAIVGRSGSGKTTLVNLLPRFYRHTEGEILLDNRPLDEYTLRNLRSHIALVTQQVTLFNDTIARNIAYGDLRYADEEDIRLAASAAYAMEFVNRLPDGLHTLVGENGVRLSGGQRQRLAIARAILKNAPVLILDEATSALDTESERCIQAALNEVMKGRTTLVIAHRLSTIENADLILVMDNGRIVESGSHAGLLARNNIYARLYRMQFREQMEPASGNEPVITERPCNP